MFQRFATPPDGAQRRLNQQLLLLNEPLSLPAVGDLHHLLLLATFIGGVHFKQMGILIHDPGDRAPFHWTFDRVVEAALLRNGLAVHISFSFKDQDAVQLVSHTALPFPLLFSRTKSLKFDKSIKIPLFRLGAGQRAV